MPIPDFQTLMLPFLETIRDGQEHIIHDVIDELADRFQLSPEERYQRSPNSSNIVFRNKIGWTKTHLKKAKLIENPRRGVVKISERGVEVLNENPPRIDMGYLSRFPEWVEFRTGTLPPGGPIVPPQEITLTPFESIDKSIQEITDELSDDLLEQIVESFSQQSERFENLVIDLLLAMGYGGSREEAGKAIGQSHDGGIDGIINEDTLGLDRIAIQAKCWANGNVSRPEVQGFVGSLEGRTKKGIFITTTDFTREARDYTDGIGEKKIVLINGKDLVQLMIKHGIGVVDVATYNVKRIDTDYFMEE